MKKEISMFSKIIFRLSLFFLIMFVISAKFEEIKSAIDRLRDESSDYLTILRDLNKLLNDCLLYYI